MRWFKPVGLLFLPISPLGWLASLLAIAFCAHIFWFFDQRAHSVTDLLYNIFPFWVPTFLGLAYIAERTGGRV